MPRGSGRELRTRGGLWSDKAIFATLWLNLVIPFPLLCHSRRPTVLSPVKQKKHAQRRERENCVQSFCAIVSDSFSSDCLQGKWKLGCFTIYSKFGGSNTLKISHAGSIVDLVSNLKIFAKKEIQLRQNNTACKINTREPETMRPPVPFFLKHNKEKRIPWSHDDHAFPHVRIFRISYVTCNSSA